MSPAFARQLVASAALLQPSPADRIVLARCQTRTALACLSAETPDLRAAQALLVDALDHIEGALAVGEPAP